MKTKTKSRWLKKPEERDYPAAESYLSLIFGDRAAARLVKKLKAAPLQEFKAKDIFRASNLPLLGATNSHVKADQKKLLEGEKLSPLLVVRQPEFGKIIIADGYHRICAVWPDFWRISGYSSRQSPPRSPCRRHSMLSSVPWKTRPSVGRHKPQSRTGNGQISARS